MRWCLAELASVAALTGDQEAAVGWLERADARAGEANRYFDPWVELDKAWVAAAAGELTRAVALATRAADMARASNQLEAVRRPSNRQATPGPPWTPTWPDLRFDWGLPAGPAS